MCFLCISYAFDATAIKYMASQFNTECSKRNTEEAEKEEKISRM